MVEMTVEQKRALATASARQRLQQQQAQSPEYSGAILPFSRDAQGNVSFDSDAGIVGMAKRAFTLPGEVWKGDVDPQSPEGMARTTEMATVASPTSAAMRAGARAIPGALTAKRSIPEAPTAVALKEASDAGYKAAGDMGVDYSPLAVKNLADTIEQELWKGAAIAENNPKTFALLRNLQQPPDDAVGVGLNYLDALRKMLGDVAGGDEKRAATIAIKHIDRFLEASDPASVVVRAAPPKGSTGLATQGHDFGPADIAYSRSSARDAASRLREARGNAAAGFRSRTINGLEDAAELRSDATGSGRNLGNTIRSRLASLLLNNGGKETRGFSPKEIAGMRDITHGTVATNATRRVGNMLGGGGGMGQSLTAALGAGAGYAMGDGMGAMIGAAVPTTVGNASRSLYNNLTKRQLKALDEVVRKRSPLYAEMMKNAPLEMQTPEVQSFLIRSLLYGPTVRPEQ